MNDTTRKMPIGITTVKASMLDSIGGREPDDISPGEPFPFIPCGHFVAIKVHKVSETRGGIILTDSTPDDAYQSPVATVLAVGPRSSR